MTPIQYIQDRERLFREKFAIIFFVDAGYLDDDVSLYEIESFNRDTAEGLLRVVKEALSDLPRFTEKTAGGDQEVVLFDDITHSLTLEA